MTDGQNSAGASESDFERFFDALPAAVRAVPVHIILFGDGSPTLVDAIARLTGGSVHDARIDSLDQVFREVRGYQ